MKKTKGQTILETAIVFFAVAVLIFGAVTVFSNFGSDVFQRLKTFKQSRYNAVRGIIQGIGAGMNPLDYALFNKKFGSISIYIPDTIWSDDMLYEKRILSAQLKLEYFENTLDVISPYKVNQMKKIINDSNFRADDDRMVPVRYANEIRSQCTELLNYMNRAYQNLYAPKTDGDVYSIQGGALALFKVVFDYPTKYGPYYATCETADPDTCDDPRLPTLESVCANDTSPECQEEFLRAYGLAHNMLKTSIVNNRLMLEQTINSLELSQYGGMPPTDPNVGGVYGMFYTMPINPELIPDSGESASYFKGLKGRLNYIYNNIRKSDDYWWGGQTLYHTVCHNLINELVDDFFGSISPCLLSDAVANQSNTVNTLLDPAAGEPTKNEVQTSYDLAITWPAILFPPGTGAGDTGYARSLTEEIADDLDAALEAWPDQDIRAFYTSSGYYDNWALWSITAINRRNNYP